MGMHRRSLLAAAIAAPLAGPALAQPSRARTLRFMPQAALANLDPIFSPSTIITTHAEGGLASAASFGSWLTMCL